MSRGIHDRCDGISDASPMPDPLAQRDFGTNGAVAIVVRGTDSTTRLLAAPSMSPCPSTAAS